LVTLAVALWLVRIKREHDPVQRAWLRFCKRLAKQGLARAPYEGALDFAARATSALAQRSTPPERLGALRAIAERYAALRYGRKPDKVAVAAFIRLTRSF
jgi:hypothetical protein